MQSQSLYASIDLKSDWIFEKTIQISTDRDSPNSLFFNSPKKIKNKKSKKKSKFYFDFLFFQNSRRKNYNEIQKSGNYTRLIWKWSNFGKKIMLFRRAVTPVEVRSFYPNIYRHTRFQLYVPALRIQSYSLYASIDLKSDWIFEKTIQISTDRGSPIFFIFQ